MAPLTLSDQAHHRLQSFRRNTWKAIALCLAVRIADATFALGLVQPAPSLAAQEIVTCPAQLETAQ